MDGPDGQETAPTQNDGENPEQENLTPEVIVPPFPPKDPEGQGTQNKNDTSDQEIEITGDNFNEIVLNTAQNSTEATGEPPKTNEEGRATAKFPLTIPAPSYNNNNEPISCHGHRYEIPHG